MKQPKAKPIKSTTGIFMDFPIVFLALPIPNPISWRLIPQWDDNHGIIMGIDHVFILLPHTIYNDSYNMIIYYLNFPYIIIPFYMI